ncbi:MAG: glycosyltransferase family 39 protein [Acidobacteria bacterium]|nr:glycosyltransferase family 39 protein [Acidobacteriota bacterium]
MIDFETWQVTLDALRANIRRLARSPWGMVAVGLVIRLVVMGFLFDLQLDPARDHFAFGFEMGKIARSIATGHGFSSPYPEPTGPTALVAPVYPYLLAGVFKLFGTYSTASAIVILTLNDLFSALTCVPLFLIARKVFGLRVALWAGWTWALFPYAIGLSNLWIWETSLTTLLFTSLILATLRLEQARRLAPWLGYGVLWGIAGLTSPSVLSSLPFLGAWLWFRHRRTETNCRGPMLASALVFLACVSIWLVRDYRTFGKFIFLRSNFALEFRVGNNDDASTPESEIMLPPDNPVEMKKLRRMGEMAYMAEKQQEVKEFLSQQPGRFVWLSLRRILYVWTGVWSFHPSWKLDDEQGVPNILACSLLSVLAFLGLRRAIQNGPAYSIPLAIVLLCFPLVYYVTHADVRYRHPIDPEIVLLAVYGALGAFRAGVPAV